MIAIAGGKGGCGKTTSALGVARALAAAGQPSRVVDLDTGMPNLHRMAEVERGPDLMDVAGPEGPDAQRDEYGVEILPAPTATTSSERAEALQTLPDPRVCTILDTPAGAGPEATQPLRLADAVILVSTNRRESLEDAAKTGRIARRLGLPVLGGVITRREDDQRGSAGATLGTERVEPVPERHRPLTNTDVQDSYTTVGSWVQEFRAQTGGEGTAAERTRAAGEPTRPPERRSRPVRASGGARSSSRGGAAPSGRR